MIQQLQGMTQSSAQQIISNFFIFKYLEQLY